MAKEVYLVDYDAHVEFTIPVMAEDKDEAVEIANKALDTGAYVPDVQDQLTDSREYYGTMEASWGWSLEDALETFGRVYDGDKIIESEHEEEQ